MNNMEIITRYIISLFDMLNKMKIYPKARNFTFRAQLAETSRLSVPLFDSKPPAQRKSLRRGLRQFFCVRG